MIKEVFCIMKLGEFGNILLEYEEVLISKIEKYKGIDFSERYVEGAIRYKDELIHYETIRRRQFKKVLKAFWKECKEHNLGNVLDYGSGKGYILYLLAESGLFKTVTGIEILPELCEICYGNMGKLNCSDVDIINVDARTYTQIDYYDVFFMFNPFPKSAMQEVVKRIDESLERKPRKLCIIYVNNVHDDMILNRINSIKKKSEINNMPRCGCKSAIYINF